MKITIPTTTRMVAMNVRIEEKKIKKKIDIGCDTTYECVRFKE